jgi:hypothetical protein
MPGVLQSVGQLTLPVLSTFGVIVTGVVGVVFVGVVLGVGVEPVGVGVGVTVGGGIVDEVGGVVEPPLSPPLDFVQPAMTTNATATVRIGSRRIAPAASKGR